MKLDGANEADVREEIAAPLLALLGYVRGTDNDILREFSLSYDRFFLGRKKSSDPPLRGRADYVLAVNGAGRWTLETKATSEPITSDDIDQVISYARHPEVSAYYAAILNGHRFVLFFRSQGREETPIVDINVESVETLAQALRGTLSPAAIRRDCSPPIVDLREPIAEGYRSSAKIAGGLMTITDCEWQSKIHLPNQVRQPLDETCRILTGYRSNVTGGHVERSDTSRIIARLEWAIPHDDMLQFTQDKGLMNFDYVLHGTQLSTDPTDPSVFDVVGTVNVYEGEQVFDLVKWKSFNAGIEMSLEMRGQAVGHLDKGIFIGNFQSEYEMMFPVFPGFVIQMYTVGDFSVQLDTR